MPLGLPPHLAAQTTFVAVARAGRAAAAASLVGAGVIVLALQAYLPEASVWPAFAILLPMLVLLWLVERTGSALIAAGYVAIGGLCIVWFSFLVSVQLGTPVANDEYIIVLLKLALLFMVGVTPGFWRSIAWPTAGYLVGELAGAAALMALGEPWRLDGTPLLAYVVLITILATLRIQRLAERRSLPEVYRAARDEMLSETRRIYQARATAYLHDTVLNQLAVIAHSPPTGLSDSARAGIRSDLETIVGQEWLRPAEDAGGGGMTERLLRVVTEAAGSGLRVDVTGDAALLELLLPDTREEFLRAIGQAVANVRRHADIDSAEVIIGGDDREVSAMVIDAGRGFVASEDALAASRAQERLGVGTSIVGRLESVGGSATVWSQPGKGTSVLLRVPVLSIVRDTR